MRIKEKFRIYRTIKSVGTSLKETKKYKQKIWNSDIKTFRIKMENEKYFEIYKETKDGNRNE